MYRRRTRAKRLIVCAMRDEYPYNPPQPDYPSPTPAAGTTNGEKLFNGFASCYGAKEWDQTLSTIQTWYYGSYVKSNWCASSMSYFANLAGCLNRIGGKNENVFDMMVDCQTAAGQGLGVFYPKNAIPNPVPNYAVCFFLWSGNTMTAGSSKHVTLCQVDNGDGTISCIGGNQSDRIRTTVYDKSKLYAVYVIGD